MESRVSRARGEAALRSEQRLYERIVDEAFDLRLRIAGDGRIQLCPQDSALLLGCAPEALVGRPLVTLLHPKDCGELTQALERMRKTGDPAALTIRLRDARGRWRAFRGLAVSPVSGPGEMLLVAREIPLPARDGRTRIRSPRVDEPTDALTTMRLRPAFERLLGEAVSEAWRGRRHVAVFAIGLDRLSLVNDELGRAAGDRVLAEQGRRLAQLFAGRGEVARGDGDGFLAFVPLRKDAHDAASVATDLRSALGTPIALEQQVVFSTASVGIALYPADGRVPERLIERAFSAMRYAKRADGDAHAFCGALAHRRLGRLTLDAGLRDAVDKGELELAYQPILDIERGTVVGCEALVRWRHPVHGHLLPEEFLAVSEETGAIVSIGAWVLRRACQQARAWRRAGLGALRVAVNVSARQLRDERFADLVRWVLAATELNAGDLTLEITESVAVRVAEQDGSSLRGLRRAGVDVAIDDFGMGHASLAYLKHLPVNQVKIDKAFVQGAVASAVDAAIVRGIATMAREMGMGLVAEGVETAAHAAFARAAGCREVQGFLYAPPLAAAEFERFVESTPSCSSSSRSCRSRSLTPGDT